MFGRAKSAFYQETMRKWGQLFHRFCMFLEHSMCCVASSMCAKYTGMLTCATTQPPHYPNDVNQKHAHLTSAVFVPQARASIFAYFPPKTNDHLNSISFYNSIHIYSIYSYTYPIGSMYGIFTYIWLKFMVNVGEYTIH